MSTFEQTPRPTPTLPFAPAPAPAAPSAEELEADKAVRLWTDDYSNLFQVVKR